MARRAASSARCQLASQELAGTRAVGPAGAAVGTPVSSTAAATSVDIRAWSAQWPGPWAMTTCRTPGLRSRAVCGRDRPGRPAEMITSGRCAAMNCAEASRYW